MQTKKKVKLNSQKGPGFSLKNYPKLIEKRTCECVRELLTFNLDKDSAGIDTWLTWGNSQKIDQCVFLIVDEISGRELEDLLASASSSIKSVFNNKTKFARMNNKSLSKNPDDVYYGMWSEILVRNPCYKKLIAGDRESGQKDIEQIVKHEQNLEPTSTNGKASPSSANLLTNPPNVTTSFHTNDSVISVTSSSKTYYQVVYDTFSKHLLTASKMKEHFYPDTLNSPDYQNTKDLPDLGSKILSIDCEMVETTKGIELARITIVDYEFNLVYDTLVQPQNEVTNYHTHITGITENSYTTNKFVSFAEMHSELKAFIGPSTILVGHSLENDLHAMRLVHDKVIDTSIMFLKDSGYKHSLKNLAYNYFRAKIQQGSHNSLEDAQVALALAKLKIEILSRLDESIFQDKGFKLEFLRDLCSHAKIMILDFDYNIKPLLAAGIFVDKIAETTDVISKLQKHMEMPLENSSFCQMVLGRYLMHKKHDFDDKLKILVDFIESLQAWKLKMPDRLFCMTTVSYHKKPEASPFTFGYDLMLLL